MDQTKLFIGAVILIGAFVAMWWFGWFAPVTRTFQGIKQNSVQQQRR